MRQLKLKMETNQAIKLFIISLATLPIPISLWAYRKCQIISDNLLFPIWHDYSWIWLSVAFPLYIIASILLLQRLKELISSVYQNFWGIENDKLSNLEIRLSGLNIFRRSKISTWQESYAPPKERLFALICLGLASSIAVSIFIGVENIEKYNLSSVKEHWMRLDGFLYWGSFSYAFTMGALITPNYWIKTYQILLFLRFSLCTSPEGSKFDSDFVNQDGFYGLRQIWNVSVKIGLTVLTLGGGWFTALYFTFKGYEFPYQATIFSLSLIIFSITYLIMTCLAFLPTIWSVSAIKTRKIALLKPWIREKVKIEELYLSSDQDKTSRQKHEASIEFINKQIENLRAMPEMPIGYPKLFGFIILQLSPVLLSAISAFKLFD